MVLGEFTMSEIIKELRPVFIKSTFCIDNFGSNIIMFYQAQYLNISISYD
jgi:hypothetical protein